MLYSPYNIKITYFGNVRSIASWSKVAREMLNSLKRLGVNINIYERRGFLYDKNFNLDSLSDYVLKDFIGDVIFTFEHPLNYRLLPDNKLKIAFLVYEFTRLPDIWVENINKFIDLVFVPSYFTYDVFIKSGVKKEKVKILRYGFNPEFYYGSDEKRKIRKFLTIASPHKREGLDLLLYAFYNAFSKMDDVKLILKLSYSGEGKSFEIRNFKKMIEDYKAKLKNKLYIIDRVLTEREMGELYRESDIYFSLSKAESFGLCFLESLASKRSVMAIGYGGVMDFLSNENSIFIDYKMVKTDGEEYEKTHYLQYVSLPDINDCIYKLRKVYKDGVDKKIYLKDCSYYYWDKIAEEFVREIIKIT